MTPPHASRCRERAVAATRHPSLQLPPLPHLEGVKRGASESNGETAAAAAALPAQQRSSASPSPSPGIVPTKDTMTSLEMDQMERAAP